MKRARRYPVLKEYHACARCGEKVRTRWKFCDRCAHTARDKNTYRLYLKSPEWKRRRAAALQRAGGICERCKERPAKQVHHRSYDRLGAELPQDLEAVCGTCHIDEHFGGSVRTELRDGREFRVVTIAQEGRR